MADTIALSPLTALSRLCSVFVSASVNGNDKDDRQYAGLVGSNDMQWLPCKHACHDVGNVIVGLVLWLLHDSKVRNCLCSSMGHSKQIEKKH